jgi:hypothetical protein
MVLEETANTYSKKMEEQASRNISTHFILYRHEQYLHHGQCKGIIPVIAVAAAACPAANQSVDFDVHQPSEQCPLIDVFLVVRHGEQYARGKEHVLPRRERLTTTTIVIQGRILRGIAAIIVPPFLH